MMGDLNRLKQLVFASDNTACFIERDRILQRLEREMPDPDAPDYFARILSALLAEVSTPVLECDYFAGRVVEAPPEEGIPSPHTLLCTVGHLSPDYSRLLALGLKGILADIEAAAAAKGDAESLSFAHNARLVVEAVRGYAARYARAAEEKGLVQAARALRSVPYEPTYDYYSALQSIWLMHMIASCYVGSRDYAFGRFDDYMLPYYEQALAEGHTEQELTELLAGFMLKTNEICGRTTHNHACKPVLCHSSKQYINIGGDNPNAFSHAVLKAAALNNLAQPQIVVLLDADADAHFTEEVFRTLSLITDKMNIYNYPMLVRALLKKGVPEAVARDCTYSACCTFDLNCHSFRNEYFTPVPQLFVQTLHGADYSSLAEFLTAFRETLRRHLQTFIDGLRNGLSPKDSRKYFVLDSLLQTDTAVQCRYANGPNLLYNVINIFLPGIATLGDSLLVLDKLVFQEKRYSFAAFAEILANDYAGHEALLREIGGYTMFGNDTPADEYTALICRTMLEAVDSLQAAENFYILPGFYSLERDNLWRSEIGATPNGRRAGQPFSENQSPTYGTDKNGVTALLNSLAKLPFDRTFGGGLNLSFSGSQPPELLRALICAYFEAGGLHTGISVIDRQQLQDAMAHPENHSALTVRLYGFSEYFVSLPEWQQLALLERTALNG